MANEHTLIMFLLNTCMHLQIPLNVFSTATNTTKTAEAIYIARETNLHLITEESIQC
jgi:hypothetical protein